MKKVLLLLSCLAFLAGNVLAAPQAASPELPHIDYNVRPGDNLTTIAKKHNVTVDMIRQASGITGDRLNVGQVLKIPTYKLSIWVDKSENTLVLKADEQTLRSYSVATGKDNSTPVGTFKITDKLENPTWYKSGAVKKPGEADNQLGTRWMGWDLAHYGIHGTIAPESIGTQATAGCVRMKNEDVEELYRLVPSGTPVTVSD
jgi:lipoprotein-anchoring transpeptidase ErfK/SrfK